MAMVKTMTQKAMSTNSRKILILLGPNLNMLGVRDPALYGAETMEDIRQMCETDAKTHGLTIDFRQSNHEGELVTWIQEERQAVCGIIINAGAYTHTSLAIHDALELLDVPIIEVHHSDPEQREAFRHFSYISLLAAKVIKGKKSAGYGEAIAFLSTLVNK